MARRILISCSRNEHDLKLLSDLGAELSRLQSDWTVAREYFEIHPIANSTESNQDDTEPDFEDGVVGVLIVSSTWLSEEAERGSVKQLLRKYAESDFDGGSPFRLAVLPFGTSPDTLREVAYRVDTSQGTRLVYLSELISLTEGTMRPELLLSRNNGIPGAAQKILELAEDAAPLPKIEIRSRAEMSLSAEVRTRSNSTREYSADSRTARISRVKAWLRTPYLRLTDRIRWTWRDTKHRIEELRPSAVLPVAVPALFIAIGLGIYNAVAFLGMRLLDIQFAFTPEEALWQLAAIGEEGRADLLSSIAWDWPLIVAYGISLPLLALAGAVTFYPKQPLRTFGLWLAGLTLLAPIADVFENCGTLALLDRFPGYMKDSWIPASVSILALIKSSLILASFGFAVWAFWRWSKRALATDRAKELEQHPNRVKRHWWRLWFRFVRRSTSWTERFANRFLDRKHRKSGWTIAVVVGATGALLLTGAVYLFGSGGTGLTLAFLIGGVLPVGLGWRPRWAVEPPKEPTPEPQPPEPPIPLVSIPAGRFRLGRRTLLRPFGRTARIESFEMAQFAITRATWREIMPKARVPREWREPEDQNLPANYVTWLDAVEFCNALTECDNQRAGREVLQVAYDIERDADGNIRNVSWNREADGYRLPTEVEWEYACRAGTTTPYPWEGEDEATLSEHAWWEKNSEGRVHPVGEKPANGFDLYDMIGNVWEWCWDAYNHEPLPEGREGLLRVLRGGSFRDDDPRRLRSADRDEPEFRFGDVGFRYVRSPRRQPLDS